MAFRAVHKDCDGKENAADWHFAASENRAGGDAELMRASLALRADSKSYAVFAAATIEFIGEFNV